MRGNVTNGGIIPVRVHSEYLTGDVICSLRSDCRDQLESALKMIGKMEKGNLFFMRLEGR